MICDVSFRRQHNVLFTAPWGGVHCAYSHFLDNLQELPITHKWFWQLITLLPQCGAHLFVLQGNTYTDQPLLSLPFASAAGGGWSGTSEFVMYRSPTIFRGEILLHAGNILATPTTTILWRLTVSLMEPDSSYESGFTRLASGRLVLVPHWYHSPSWINYQLFPFFHFYITQSHMHITYSIKLDLYFL